jgi:hypothetical protein
MNAKATATLLAWALLGLGGGLVHADDSHKLSGSVTADFYNKYIWRGQVLNAEAAFQPGVSLGMYGFTGGVWGSFDLTDENGHRGEFTEVDLSLDYTRALPGLEAVKVSVGAIHYRFPHTNFDPTSELYVGAGLSCTCDKSKRSCCLGCLLSPAAKLYYDVDQIDGAYLQLSVGHTIEKIARLTEDCFCHLQVGASLGVGSSKYNEGYFGVDQTALNDLTVSIGLPLVLKSVTIKPSVSYATMLGQDIRAATASSDNAWVGVSVSYAF